MAQFTTRLRKVHTIARATAEFIFEKPAHFTFSAGQHIEISFVDPRHNDPKGNTRLFSVVSSPQDEELVLATRLTGSPFKEALVRSEGEEFHISEAMGDLVLHKDESRPAVFLVGGIGITPAISMVRDACQRGLGHACTLFSANRAYEDAPYYADLIALQRRCSSFVYVPTFTDEVSSGRGGGDPEENAETHIVEQGRIDEEMLERHLDDPQLPVYYVTGPPPMVRAMKAVLSDMEVSDLQVRSEEFGGY